MLVKSVPQRLGLGAAGAFPSYCIKPVPDGLIMLGFRLLTLYGRFRSANTVLSNSYSAVPVACQAFQLSRQRESGPTVVRSTVSVTRPMSAEAALRTCVVRGGTLGIRYVVDGT